MVGGAGPLAADDPGLVPVEDARGEEAADPRQRVVGEPVAVGVQVAVAARPQAVLLGGRVHVGDEQARARALLEAPAQ